MYILYIERIADGGQWIVDCGWWIVEPIAVRRRHSQSGIPNQFMLIGRVSDRKGVDVARAKLLGSPSLPPMVDGLDSCDVSMAGMNSMLAILSMVAMVAVSHHAEVFGALMTSFLDDVMGQLHLG